ncbi:hypothetical protein DQK91_00515 [Oceanidesulfovibrio marinus]|uniref:Methyl-accepting chemotaxis protein n=1 Tax=Oceanidesulfovibrio marinus TaxID=370038 RepID=A0A6P1ZKZ1_9BACT|nr:hypothetical protein DQK91_00515 [Oceanidesulfovibrio marinus]
MFQKFVEHLRIGHKLAIMSIFFFLPIAVLLYLMVAGIQYDIRFSTLEVYGNTYQRPLEKLLADVQNHRFYKVTEANKSLGDLEQSIATSLQELQAIHDAIGVDLQFTPEGLDKRGRGGLVPERLAERWDAAKSAGDISAYDTVIADVQEMITHAGDTSNLILDPDLDSYYLMDMTLLALPQTQARLGDIMLAGANILGNPMGPAERVQMAVYAAQLQDSDIARVLGSAETALNEDQNFYGVSETLAKNLQPALDDYKQKNAIFLGMLGEIADPMLPQPSRDKFFEAGLAARQSAFDLWDTTAQELDILLGKRIDSYKSRRLISLVLAGISILVALTLTVLVGRSITRPVAQLDNYTDKVAHGDLTAVLAGRFSGELRDLAGNIKAMVDELKQRLGFSQGILDGITMPCVVVDQNRKLTFVNNQLLDLMRKGGSPEGFLGSELASFFPRNPRIAETILSCLSSETVVLDHEIQGQDMDGQPFDILLSVTPVYDLDNALLGVFAQFTVLTRIKEQEARLREQNTIISGAAERARSIAAAVIQAVEGLSAQVTQATEGAGRQKARSSETAAAMEQMNYTVLEVAKNAGSAAEQAESARERAQEGRSIVDQSVTAIGRVAELSEELRNNMAELSTEVSSIGRIMGVISDIADQTNLLALNAAIEAARAGEAGRGFAVVADEVRKLAEKTMVATQEVGSAIESIQNGAQRNEHSVVQAAEAVEEAKTLSGRSGEALAAIVSLVQSNTDQVRSIATAAEEQSTASDEINHAIDEINGISDETSQGMNGAAADVTALAEQARKLEVVIEELVATC